MELHPAEASLIKLIRSRFRWGEVIIETRDGLPHRVGKAMVWTKLDDANLSTPEQVDTFEDL